MSKPRIMKRMAAALGAVGVLLATGCGGGYTTVAIDLIPTEHERPLWPGDTPVTLVRMDATGSDDGEPDYTHLAYDTTHKGSKADHAQTIFTDPDDEYPAMEMESMGLKAGSERFTVVQASGKETHEIARLAGLVHRAHVPMLAERIGNAWVLIGIDPVWAAAYCDRNGIRWVDPLPADENARAEEPGLFLFATPTRDEGWRMMSAAYNDLENASGAVFLVLPDRYAKVSEVRTSSQPDHKRAFARFDRLAKSFVQRRKKDG